MTVLQPVGIPNLDQNYSSDSDCELFCPRDGLQRINYFHLINRIGKCTLSLHTISALEEVVTVQSVPSAVPLH